MNALMAGAIAGATGTSALNIVGYGDMALRGRPASRVPDAVAKILASRWGIDLDANRAEGAGMLLGYTDGLAFGIGYGLLRTLPGLRDVPWPLGGVALGLATLAPEFVAAALGATDPRRWGIVGWLEGLFPRAAYGLVTAATYEAIAAKDGD